MKNNYGINDASYEEMISLFKSFDSLDKVYIFGSRARGDYKEGSDIDLAIESKDDIKLRLLNKLEDIRCILNFDVVDVNNIENEKLLMNIKKEGILIYRRENTIWKD